MNKNGASGLIGAMLIAAIASWAAGVSASASAQTDVTAPLGAVVERVAVPGVPPRNRPDTSIIRDVRRAFRRVPGLDDSRIHIRVRFGVVTLTGKVPESWQISRAGIAARSVLGVRSVFNRLTVGRRR
ncbi:BON domain-containing protein [Paraburkholderia denitrificans]|uniref:BON domain-containing protein n=1 Tax=Paraburkholderia denitrificans TaxID=694025 RepID=A0ABW0J9S5_9BURK